MQNFARPFFLFLCCPTTRHIAIIKRQGGLTGTIKAVPEDDESESWSSVNCFSRAVTQRRRTEKLN
jgi:hypothetical protein